VIGIRQDEIVPDTGSDKNLPDTEQRTEFLQDSPLRGVVRSEIVKHMFSVKQNSRILSLAICR
jgi:hypothetical protein